MLQPEYYGCWISSYLRRQDIRNHGADYAIWVGCFLQRMISTIRTEPMLRNYKKYQ